jgi:hypothetical protein
MALKLLSNVASWERLGGDWGARTIEVAGLARRA